MTIINLSKIFLVYPAVRTIKVRLSGERLSSRWTPLVKPHP